jgi:predicted DNA-binding ribbon-helix-helix protein
VGSLILNLSIEEYYLWSKNTTIWDAFTTVSIEDAFWDSITSAVSAKGYKVTKGIYNEYSREGIPKGGVLRP